MTDSGSPRPLPAPGASGSGSTVHKPATVTSSKDATIGKQWCPPAKDSSTHVSLASLGGEPGSAFAKYVRKDQVHGATQRQSDETPAPGSKSSSEEPDATVADSQPSTSTVNRAPARPHHEPNNSSHMEKSGEEDTPNDGDSSSSSQCSVDSGDSNPKHSSKKRCRSDGSSQSKKQRLIWTPELHARFLAAVNHLGVKNAVPKTILQLMNVEGMTRENVASHLQKYRLYLKRLAGLPPNIPLSAETMHQVQSVQHALHQQVQMGLQTNHALQLAAVTGGVPLSALTTLPMQAAGYQDVLGQLAACSYGGGMPSIQAMTGASLMPGGGGMADHASLAALSRAGLEGAMGFIPGGLIPINLCQLPVGGLGGLHAAALLNSGGGLGVMAPLALAQQGGLRQGEAGGPSGQNSRGGGKS